MKLDLVCKTQDEFYTPPYAVEPILKYAKPFNRIWCPFDTEDSHFVKMLRANGSEVVATHLFVGQDFFTHTESCDAIISNPPYSIKSKVFERLFQLGKPFAMLVGVVGLFESEKRFTMFQENSFEIMYLSRRVAYFKNYADQKPSLNPPFSSVYLCSKMLPQQIVFERIKKDSQ